MPTRLYLPTPLAGDGTFLLDEPAVHYLTRVLRLKEGDRFQGFDSRRASYDLVLESAPMGGFSARVLQRRPAGSPLRVPIVLAQSLPKAAKMDLILRQGTEMGVNAFLPFVSIRSVSRPDREGFHHKTVRWRKILIEACRQCGRTDVPELSDLLPWKELLDRVRSHDLTLLLHEKASPPLRAVLESKPDAKSILLMVGPEGGFAPEEIHEALQTGACPTHLPTPILRCETAGLAAAAMVGFHASET